jgi:hypothetical protein
MTSVLFVFCHFARERGGGGDHVGWLGRSMSLMSGAYMLLAAFSSIQGNHLEPLLDTIYVILPGHDTAVALQILVPTILLPPRRHNS